MKIVHLPIEKLTLYYRNPRKISNEQFKKLCRSLDSDPDFFEARPCLVNEIHNEEGEHSYIVYAGNQRVLAAKKLQWDTVPCIIEKNISDEVMNERLIKDNKHYGEFDFDILANEWDVEILLKAGFTEVELNYFDDKDDEIEKKEKNVDKEEEKIKITCPGCGFQFQDLKK